MDSKKGSGVVYFFDSGTKTLVGKISVSKSDKELAEAMTAAKKAVKQ